MRLSRKSNIAKSIHIVLPASKSISNRILILNALSKEPQPILNLSDSDDTRVLQEALKGNLSHIDIGDAEWHPCHNWV